MWWVAIDIRDPVDQAGSREPFIREGTDGWFRILGETTVRFSDRLGNTYRAGAVFGLRHFAGNDEETDAGILSYYQIGG